MMTSDTGLTIRKQTHRAIRLLAISMLVWSTVGSAESSRDYIGLKKCNVCHGKELMGDQVSAWREGPHAKAINTLERPESEALAKSLGLTGSAAENPACLKCHATAYSVPEDRMAYPVLLSDAVQCESCHGPGADYRKKKIMSDPDEARAQGLWSPEKSEEVCVTCHNPESPTFDPARYTRADGTTTGFDFEQALERFTHPIPDDVKGNYIELERKQKAEKKRRKAAGL